MLRKNPGLTTVAVLTLAMAIGANAVVFSAVNGFILRPLNIAHPESLFQVRGARFCMVMGGMDSHMTQGSIRPHWLG